MDNQTLIQKAVVTADALAAGGKLNPQQSDKFLDYVVDESVIKNNCRIVRFSAETLEIDKIGVGRRLAVPKEEARDPGVRRGISTSKVILQPREVMVPVEIGDNFREINIEGTSIDDTIIKLFARQLNNDLEELYVNGDTLGPAAIEADMYEGGSTTKYIKDTFMALMNGWVRRADSGHVVDCENNPIGLSIFSKLLRALPTKFRRNKGDLRWFLAPDLWEMYLERLATRATALGDAAAGGAGHKPLGIEAVAVPLLDLLPRVVEHVVLNATTAVALRYAPIQNVVVTRSELGLAAESAYAETTDYTLDRNAGTIARVGGGGITDGQTVKVTYESNPQILCTHFNNFVIGLGRDVRIEKDRDIYKGTNQYAITVKVAVAVEEDDALAKAVNVGQSV